MRIDSRWLPVATEVSRGAVIVGSGINLGPNGTISVDLVQGATGPTGPVGPVGITGATGPQGNAGADGEQGPTGPTGPIGPTGAIGPVGPQGADGNTGATGSSGVDGATGPVGVAGPTGATGPAGVTGPAGASWTAFISGDFSTTCPSTSTITTNVSYVGLIEPGTPMKYTISGSTTYGVCTAITASLITIAGAPLVTTAGALTALWWGRPETGIQVDLNVPGAYADAIGDILYADTKTKFRWNQPAAYLVYFRAMQQTVATTTQPRVNIKLGSVLVSTANSNQGIILSTAGTWVENSAVAISTANYKISRNTELEINVSVAGSPTDTAQNLTVSCYFVFEGN